MVTLTAVTAWFEHRELERDYWQAMRTTDVEVLIVDNASEPPLPNGWRLDRNAGFAPANNIGLQLARTDAVVFVNNDVVATRPDWADQIRANVAPGVLVGAELSYSPHGDVGGHRLPYLSGWCLAGMREDLLALGGWDESFEEPSYYGDNLLCLEARAAGMTLREVNVGLRHLGNATAGPAEHSPRVRLATAGNYQRFAARARELLGEAVD